MSGVRIRDLHPVTDHRISKSSAMFRWMSRFASRAFGVLGVLLAINFFASMVWAYGVAMHASPDLSWHSYRAGTPIVQLRCFRGQIRINIEDPPPRFPGLPAGKRKWYAGISHFPGFSINVRGAHPFPSAWGLDASLSTNERSVSVATIGLYPVAAAFGAAWLFARLARWSRGGCPKCGYTLHKDATRCSECGHPADAA